MRMRIRSVILFLCTSVSPRSWLPDPGRVGASDQEVSNAGMAETEVAG
jgi:hypothetical protein